MSLTGSDQAYLPARSGLARSGATRSAYLGGVTPEPPPPGSNPVITIDGVQTGAAASRRVLIASLSIQDLLNETPNTCTFTVQGARPVEGTDLLITMGDLTLFAGSILRVTELYVGQPRNILWQVEGIDWTWRLNARLVNARYTASNAAAIAADLLARFAPPGYTLGVTEELPDVDEISFTNVVLMDAFAQLAQRIGGYASCGYDRVVRIWLTDAGTPPVPLTPSHPSLESLSYTRDLSQIVTRALVEGGGVNALADVGPGDTRIPVQDLAWYNAGGGRVVSGPQQLTYGGTVPGGAGAYVGPGIAPSSAPVVAAQTGSGLSVGAYKYAYTWQTATGETLPSPIASATTTSTGVANPTVTPRKGTQHGYDGELDANATYKFCYTYQTHSIDPGQPGNTPVTGSTVASPVLTLTTGSSGPSRSLVVDYPLPASAATGIRLVGAWQTKGNGSIFYFVSGLPSETWSGGWWSVSHEYDDSYLTNTVAIPGSNTTVGKRQVALSGIAVGPSGTTTRRIYRSAVNTTPLKLLTTVADNSTTALVDTAADATLGAAPPVTDTSGLVTAAGQALAGSTIILVSSIGPFAPDGWAIVGGNQAIRYAGVSGNQLTGIPPEGPGALTASVNYGTPILVAAQLIGIPASGEGAIVLPVKQGDPVNLLVLVDDLAAQAALAALVGGDGVVEGVLVDNRISEPEAESRAKALLAQKKDPLLTLRYRVRDPLTHSGAAVVVDLPTLGIAGTFKLQDVTIGGFLGTAHPPTYDAAASSSRFTFEDLLRQLRTQPRQLPA